MEPAGGWEVVEDVQFVEVATQLTVRVFFIEVNLYSRRLNKGEGNSNKKNHSPQKTTKIYPECPAKLTYEDVYVSFNMIQTGGGTRNRQHSQTFFNILVVSIME